MVSLPRPKQNLSITWIHLGRLVLAAEASSALRFLLGAFAAAFAFSLGSAFGFGAGAFAFAATFVASLSDRYGWGCCDLRDGKRKCGGLAKKERTSNIFVQQYSFRWFRSMCISQAGDERKTYQNFGHSLL